MMRVIIRVRMRRGIVQFGQRGLLVAKGNTPAIAALCDKLFKTGIPDDKRIDAWFSITNAKKASAGMTNTGTLAARCSL